MHAGHLSVSIHGASCNKADGEFYVAAKIDGVGKACSETYSAAEMSHMNVEELSLFVPPHCAKTMQLLVYRAGPNEGEDDELVGEGSLALDTMEMGKRNVKVGVVDKIGKNCGEVQATVRLFPCRTPGTLFSDPQVMDVLVEKMHERLSENV